MSKNIYFLSYSKLFYYWMLKVNLQIVYHKYFLNYNIITNTVNWKIVRVLFTYRITSKCKFQTIFLSVTNSYNIIWNSKIYKKKLLQTIFLSLLKNVWETWNYILKPIISLLRKKILSAFFEKKKYLLTCYFYK